MWTEDNVANFRRLIEAFSNGDLDVVDELIAPDCVEHAHRRPSHSVSAPGGRPRCFRRRCGGSIPDAAAIVGIRPSTAKRHLADLQARSGLSTEQLIYAGRAGRGLVVPSLEPT